MIITREEQKELYEVYKSALQRRFPILGDGNFIDENTITQEEIDTLIGDAINADNIATASEISKLGTLVAVKTSLEELQSVTTDPLGEPIQNLDIGIVNDSTIEDENGMYFYNGTTWIKYVTGGSEVDEAVTQDELNDALIS